MGYKWKGFVQFLGCALKRKEEGPCLSPPPPADWNVATRAGGGAAVLDHEVEDGRATRWKEPRSLVTDDAAMPGLTAKYTFTRDRIKFCFTKNIIFSHSL